MKRLPFIVQALGQRVDKGDEGVSWHVHAARLRRHDPCALDRVCSCVCTWLRELGLTRRRLTCQRRRQTCCSRGGPDLLDPAQPSGLGRVVGATPRICPDIRAALTLVSPRRRLAAAATSARGLEGGVHARLIARPDEVQQEASEHREAEARPGARHRGRDVRHGARATARSTQSSTIAGSSAANGSSPCSARA